MKNECVTQVSNYKNRQKNKHSHMSSVWDLRDHDRAGEEKLIHKTNGLGWRLMRLIVSL